MRSLLACWALFALCSLGGCAGVPRDLPRGADDAALRDRPERMVVVAVANPTGAVGTVAASSSAGYASLQPYLGSAQARRAIAALAQRHGLKEMTAWPIQALRLHCAVLELPEGAARDEVLGALSRDPRVTLAQPLQSFEMLGTAVAYNDPYLSLQHGLAQMQAVQAHAGSRGRGVAVALIDTGADAVHPDLQPSVAAVRNLVDRDLPQFRRDRHGTEVAGVIAAVANNQLGIVGVAPDARLHLYKACWEQVGGGARCNSFTLALALAASLDDGAQVINLSLAGPPDELLARLVRHALARQRVVVGAVPPDGSLVGFPLGVSGVIAVDSAERPDRPGRPGRPGVLHAPGRDILTLAPGGHYDFGSGSSLAAAHVSGLVALMLALPQAPPPAALGGLLEASRGTDGASPVNACRALVALGQPLSCGDAPAR